MTCTKTTCPTLFLTAGRLMQKNMVLRDSRNWNFFVGDGGEDKVGVVLIFFFGGGGRDGVGDWVL